MMHTSVQYTPLQVLQAARRAEAEGKMDYALQFYRHIVENHASSPEAQESREGLMRIAEWRWSETRGNQQRRQDYTGVQSPSHARYTPPPSERSDPYADEAAASERSGRMPQIIAREAAKAAEGAGPATVASHYRLAKIMAQVVSGVGWASVVAGLAITIVAVAGLVAEFAVAGLLGMPLGVVLGMPTAVIGLVLVLTGHLAIAVFDGADATLELLAIERGRTN
jgi:hypothetical protein